jgi:uncharacterized protein (TIGR00369 family)
MLPSHPHVAGLLALDIHRFMEVEAHEGAEGRSHISFPVTQKMLTPGNALHAGFVYTACDFASYLALLSLLPEDTRAVTHDLHVSVMRTAGPGERVDVRGHVVRLGRTLAFINAEASCGDRLLATARVTKSILSG